QARGFVGVFSLAVVAYTIAQQTGVRAAGFGYAFWALAIGLLIANTVGTPPWIKPALRSELYIKTGLVLLGAEILFGNILSLGVPGLFVAWVVTPTVIIFMYQFGTRVLKITSRSLVIVI
ncbi:MAG: putative sulfate exporter family transporter, partial [Gemmatimonadetes bacterium]|nr:putative sulfate exporter family transporter [Gemmatimonadota bacterium]